MSLTQTQKERYSRQMVLPGFGEEGQERLLSARVLIVGVGGLGSSAAFYLTAAGVGTLGLADGDRVELSNLHRQIAHATGDIGRPKVESAGEKCRAINPDVTVRLHPGRVQADHAPALFQDYDFVIDATDNFPAKFLVADACHLARKPYSHAGVLGFEAQTMTVLPGETACYRCLFREPPSPEAVPSPSQAGVLGALAGMVGTIQAAEAIRHLLGIGIRLTNRLLVVDVLRMRFREVPVPRNPECPLCGLRPSLLTPRGEPSNAGADRRKRQA